MFLNHLCGVSIFHHFVFILFIEVRSEAKQRCKFPSAFQRIYIRVDFIGTAHHNRYRFQSEGILSFVEIVVSDDGEKNYGVGHAGGWISIGAFGNVDKCKSSHGNGTRPFCGGIERSKTIKSILRSFVQNRGHSSRRFSFQRLSRGSKIRGFLPNGTSRSFLLRMVQTMLKFRNCCCLPKCLQKKYKRLQERVGMILLRIGRKS